MSERWVYPDYYPSFTCIASACRHNCCIGWEIDVDPETLAVYQKTDGPMGQRLKESLSLEGDPHFILGEDERCPFLNGDNLCDLILHGGEGFLCQICTDHPRFRNELPGRSEIGVGLCCEAAARLILTRKEPVFLCLSGEEGETDEETETLLTLREQAVAIAQDRTRSMAEREEALLDLAMGWIPELTPARWADFYLELERLDDSWTEILLNLQARGDTWDIPGFETYMGDRQTEYEQLLVYFLYRHLLGAWEDGDVAGRVSFAVLSVRILRLLGGLHWQQHGTFSLEDQVEYARLYSAEIEYSQDNLYTVLEALG